MNLIAFYLPQFHPISENDIWWGKGFTEWTNVVQAKPLFKGHYQPRLPADLGFYDLRVPEVRDAQAEMALNYGIDAFCYWHYWFGDGQRILERPFQEVLNSGKPNFPFCLAWANETWTGHWKGEDDKILIKQTYGGIKDYERHFYNVLPAFLDARYFRVDGNPLFYIYSPRKLPEPEKFISLWRKLAHREGINDIFFVAGGWYDNFNDTNLFDLKKYGFNAKNSITPKTYRRNHRVTHIKKRILRKLGLFSNSVNYLSAVDKMLDGISEDITNIPSILTGWDTTPRSGMNGWVMTGYTPETFRIHVENIMREVQEKPNTPRIIFVKSWNEWAEGNYLEPDMLYGHKYLDVLRTCKNHIMEL